MDLFIPSCILLFSFILFICIRLPIVFALIASSLITAIYINLPPLVIWQRMVQGVQSFSLLAIPFFILAGEIMLEGGIAKRLVAFADVLVGRIRGGLAEVNIVACAFFGAVSGSTTASISSIGATMIPMMEKQGYNKVFATNVNICGSTQAMIIPPSHNMIIYAMAAGGVSAGKLFLGGLVAGIILMLSFMIITYIICVKQNYPKGKSYNLKEALSASKDSILGMLTIVIILVGVVSGFFTATESAAIACLYAFFITFFVYKEIPLSAIWRILSRTGKTLAMVMTIIAAANGFGYMLSYLRIPAAITSGLLNITSDPIMLLLLINIMLLVLGCIMDVAPLIVIVTPILMPIISSIGVDPVHFGIIMLLNLAIGNCTPPVGLALFTGCAVGRVPIEKVMKGIMPFYMAMVIALLIVTYFPGTIMWLPDMFM